MAHTHTTRALVRPGDEGDKLQWSAGMVRKRGGHLGLASAFEGSIAARGAKRGSANFGLIDRKRQRTASGRTHTCTCTQVNIGHLIWSVVSAVCMQTTIQPIQAARSATSVAGGGGGGASHEPPADYGYEKLWTRSGRASGLASFRGER
jgi:hypothetical protein